VDIRLVVLMLLSPIASFALCSCGGDDFTEPSASPNPPDASSDSDAVDAVEDAAPDASTADVDMTCAIQTTLAPCDECINASCLDSCQKCADNTACQAIFNCVIATCVTDSTTPDLTCAENCVKANPAGLATFGAFWMGLSPGCVSSKCGAQCPW